MIASAVDEVPAILLETHWDEMDRNDHILALESDEFDDSSGGSLDSDRLTSNRSWSEKIHSTADDSSLKLEIHRVGCDWLPKELDTSPLPLIKERMQDSVATQTTSSNGEAIFLKPEPANSPVESASLSKKSVPLARSTDANSCHTANGIPLSLGGRKATPGSATPTGRASLRAKSKHFHPSAPTLKAPKPVAAQGRSSTPARVASIRSKSSRRFATPTLEPSSQAMTSIASSKDQSSSRRKAGPVMSKFPERPCIPATISLNAKSRQKPCTASRIGVQVGTHHKSESVILTRNRGGHTNGADEVNPVLMGSKMVERVVNMRKLAPPKQSGYSSQEYTQKNSHGSSGFGRSLSKKSLDMAIRHMDIRRSIPDNIRPPAL